MQITIRLLSIYRRYLPPGQDVQAGYALEVAPGTRLVDILADLPIPSAETYTCLVNGRHTEGEKILTEGDVVAIFPTAGGG